MEQVTVVQALSAVMADVGAVGKGDTNRSQGWSFRGVDSVVNAVSPALRKHGVVVVPFVEDHEVATVQTSGGKPMQSVRVKVTYTFYGPGGDTVVARSVGEAFDSGDKATAKAMSVALRTCLLQSLMLPTDDPDPDHEVYQVEVNQFDPADVGTWPDVLSQAQAKQVVLVVAGGDKGEARRLWDGIAEWGSYPAGDVDQWVAEVSG